MIFEFLRSGKAKQVFKALLESALLEAKFGRLIEPLEPDDFCRN